MKKRPALSIIVPAFKKQKSIQKDLEYIYSVVKRMRYSTEIICVVDGFVDKTYENAQKAAKKIKVVKVLGYKDNKGKGYAVRFGMAHAKGKIVAFIDAGMDINPNGLSLILEHFEWYSADVIVGSKRHPVSKVKWTTKRKIYSHGYQMLTRLLFGLSVKDTQVGIKCYRKEVLESVLPRLIVKRYAFDVEILAVAQYLGFTRMYEAPVEINFSLDKSSSAASIKHIFNMIWDTFAIFYRMKILNYYSSDNRRNWFFDPQLNFKISKIC